MTRYVAVKWDAHLTSAQSNDWQIAYSVIITGKRGWGGERTVRQKPTHSCTALYSNCIHRSPHTVALHSAVTVSMDWYILGPLDFYNEKTLVRNVGNTLTSHRITPSETPL